MQPPPARPVPLPCSLSGSTNGARRRAPRSPPGRAQRAPGGRGASCLRLHFAGGTASAGRGSERPGLEEPERGEAGPRGARVLTYPPARAAALLVGPGRGRTHFPSRPVLGRVLFTLRSRRGPSGLGSQALALLAVGVNAETIPRPLRVIPTGKMETNDASLVP